MQGPDLSGLSCVGACPGGARRVSYAAARHGVRLAQPTRGGSFAVIGLREYNWPGVSAMRMRQDKAHREGVRCFLDRITKGGPPLISFDELNLVTRATFAVVRSATEGTTLRLDDALDSAADAVPPEVAVV